MSDFEYLFALFGLLFGLIVAEVSLKFADAIEANRLRPIGVLAPALAFLILTDLTNFWLFLWGFRTVLEVSWRTVFAGVLLAMIYFLAAALASLGEAPLVLTWMNIIGHERGSLLGPSCS